MESLFIYQISANLSLTIEFGCIFALHFEYEYGTDREGYR